MGAPAMGIGQFLAAALGTMAVGGASGMAQMKIRDEMDTKKFIMQSLQKALFDRVMGEGFTPTEEMSKAAFGSYAKQVHPLLVGMGQARQQAVQARDRMGFVQPGEGEGGGGQGTLMGPAAVAPQGMQMGSGAPSLAGAPSAAPQPGAVLGMMAGGPAAAQAMGRPSTPVIPQPEMIGGPAPESMGPTISQLRQPQPQPEPGALRPGMTRPGVTMTMPGPGGGTMTLPDSAKAQVKSLMTWANSAGASPRRLQEQAAKVGATIPKDVYDQYAEMDYNKNLPSYLAQAAIEGATGSEALQQAMLKMGYERGWTPPAVQTMAFPNQQTRDDWSARFLATQGRNIPLAKVWEAQATLGISISDAERKRQLDASTADLTARLTAQDKTLAANPDKLAFAVAQAQGFAGQTAESMRAMSRPAAASERTKQALAESNVAAPLERDLGGPAMAPSSTLRLGREAAETTAARETERLAAAREVGQATGTEQAKGIKTVSDEKTLMQLVDREGNPPPPGLTERELDARIANGTYGRLGVDRKVYVGFNQVVGTINSYEQILARPNNIFTRPTWTRFLSEYAAGPWEIGVAGWKTDWQMPRSEELQKRLKLSDQDVKDIQQVITIRNLGAAHIRALDEKGQGMTAKLYQAGIRSFPGTLDDKLSAEAKIAAFRIVLKTRLDEAVTWRTPTPSTYKGVKIELLPGGR